MGLIKFDSLEDKIIEIRDEKVLLDSDIANLYGVETKRINEAVKNNLDKFPDGYIVELTKEEWNILKSKISTSSWGGKRKVPKAFTEKGLYMLATILKSKIATLATISIIETFSKLRTLSSTLKQLPEALTKKNNKT